MLETPQSDRSNFRFSFAVAGILAIASISLAIWFSPGWLFGLPLSGTVFWWLRRQTRRRLKVMSQPLPEVWEGTLQSRVEFFRALEPAEQDRFRNLMKVFIDEVAITGIGTEVDESTRALVAASAIIPIFGFEDFEYRGLGEVLIYPDSFNRAYDSQQAEDRNILGMVGVKHLSGVMILSKPSLIAGFDNPNDKRNVGIHEFAHLVDKQAGEIDGVPASIPQDTIDPWIRWVGEELRRDGSHGDINDYAYTNEAEYFAVLSEYFFESPARLQRSHPKLYAMMRAMYHQDVRRRFAGKPKRRRRVRRNDPCPCGSGEKYKACCRLKRMNT